MKIYKQVWFWLMMIFIALLVLLFIFLAAFFPYICKIICKDWFWTAIGAIATAVSVIIALITYQNDVKIKSKQKTYDAVYQLKKDVYCIERMVGKLSGKDIDDIIHEKSAACKNTKSCNKRRCNEQKWECITKYLTNLEHFSTCVNNGIFDAETVKNMSGDYLIKQINILKPIIEYKARENKGLDTYKQLKEMINIFSK